MKPGIYKICHVVHGDDDSEQQKHWGRIAVVNGHTQVLEDTEDGFLSKAFPDGIVDDRKQRRWAQLRASPYFRVSPEGIHDDESQDMPQPEAIPEETYDIIDSDGKAHLLEAYGNNLFLDGQKLSAERVEDMQRRVHLGELHLLPRAAQ